MHIMEGFLPIEWAVFWTVIFVPFLIIGIIKMKKFFEEHPEKKLSVALSGAFIVILSSLKIPSVTGSSSHPTGTGMSVMLSGPWITVVICTIVLIFQGTFMAHGGFTTLGANVFSMGIAGPFAAYYVFKFMKKVNINSTVTVFTVVCVANIITYLVTALQLTLIVPYEGIGAFAGTFATFLGIFAVTQIPIAILEGFLMVLFFSYLAAVRPDIVADIGIKGRTIKGILNGRAEEDDRDPKPQRSRLLLASFIVTAAVLIVFVYVMMFLGDMGGADDAGANSVFSFIPGYEKLTENIIQLGDFGISILFIIQTLIGILILAYVLHRLLNKKEKKESKRQPRARRGKERKSEFTTIDAAAYKSPMLHWSPVAKLILILSLLVLDIASKSIMMSLFACAIGLSLFLYGSSFRPPALLTKLFLIAQTFIIVAAFIFTIVISGEAVASVNILGFTITFTDAGVSFALLVYVRATAALLLMFSFAVSTPVPYFANALRKLKVPQAFVEMLVLIYRYTFLLLESAEKMHLAAECKFGYCGYKKSIGTTSKLAVGVFLRSLDTAEKGQVALQCRNYRGEFISLSMFEKKNRAATVLCAALVGVSVVLFLMLYYGVL